MSQVGELALQGTKEYIIGPHTFTITTQENVKANGLMVQLDPSDKDANGKQAKSTGVNGWTLKKGDKVRVYKAYVVFE
jgi:hypothetical protein